MELGLLLSWIFGSISNALWLFVCLPQFIKNYRSNSSDAVSYHLILFWFIGDICLVFASLYKELSPVLISIGIYHIIIDVIFLIQVLYYRLISDENIGLLDNRFQVMKNIFFKNEIQLLFTYSSSIFIIKLIIDLNPSIHHYIGEIFAWMSTIIFATSRIPQIILNHQRKSVVGLSIISFITIVVGNVLFLLCLLIRLIDIENKNEYILQNLQWIIGSSSILFFDMYILYQFYEFHFNEEADIFYDYDEID